MQSSSAVAEKPAIAPTMGDGAAAWSALCRKVKQRAALDAEIIELTGEVQRSGTIETLEGVPLDTALNLVHRLTAADRGMLLTAADVLPDMPETMALLKGEVLSWSQVRAIVAEAKRLSRQDRAMLDAHIGASADLIGKIDPDDAVDAVRIVVEELRGLRRAEQAEERTERANFVWGQPAMFGPGTIYGQLDNLSLAAVLGRMDAMAPPDDGRSLSQRRADGLVAMATHRCTGDDSDIGAAPDANPSETPRLPTRHRVLDRATSSVTVCLDYRDATPTAAGTIQINAPGCLPTITAKAAEALAHDASIQVVLFDGERPLAATRKVWARDIPADVRHAVKVRDGGDRFPGSRGPIEHIHHFDKRGKGHHVDHLIGLKERSHKRIHRCGWAVSLDPQSGEATFSRGERTWITLPRGTRLRRPPPRPGDDDPPG